MRDPPEIVSIKAGLPIKDIAKYWARELKGTVWETTEERLLYELTGSVEHGVLTPDPDGWPPCLEDALYELSQPHDHKEELLIEGIVVAREEFLRWIKEEGFVPRPTFWDDEQAPARGGVPTADNENLTRLGAWAQDQINAGNIPGETMGFSWKEAERRAKAAFPTLRGTSGRQLRRLFDKLLGRPSA
jgi:hypothetical protein